MRFIKNGPNVPENAGQYLRQAPPQCSRANSTSVGFSAAVLWAALSANLYSDLATASSIAFAILAAASATSLICESAEFGARCEDMAATT
jgi:hypothetical protein